MNWFTHTLFAINVLLLMFKNEVSLLHIVLFAFVFGVVVDLDHIGPALLRAKRRYERSWIQEPLSIILVGLPVGIIMSRFVDQGLWLVLIPFASHILLDYMSFHTVAPWSPFSKEKVRVGFIKPIPCHEEFRAKKGISEGFVMILNVVVLMVLLG